MYYELDVKGTKFTCPKGSITILAMTKAKDRNEFNPKLFYPDGAVEYLESLGIKVNIVEGELPKRELDLYEDV